MRLHLVALALILNSAVGSAATTGAPDASPSTQLAFDRAVADFARQVDGKIGFAAVHLESGHGISVNGDDSFPMASTVKIAVAALVLTRIDRGEVTLDQMIEVKPVFLEQTGPVADSAPHPGAILSVANLLELMLTKSNNTATDMMVRLAGGPKAVTAYLRRAGIDGQRMDGDVHSLLQRFYGFPSDQPFLAAFMDRLEANPDFMDQAYQPNPDFEANPADSSTPLAMNALLVQLYAGELLSPERTDFLRKVMERCVTGQARIKGMLPPGTVVAHKTGTLGGSVNDVGVITLPGELGHVVISVFVTGSAADVEERDKAIAQVARSAYDYFLFR